MKVLWRLPTLFKTVQQKAIKDKVHEKFPLILTSGRLVEYEGGGDETRSNPWLAELQQESFVEINPKAAADRGMRNGEYVWVSTPARTGGARLKVKAQGHRGRGPGHRASCRSTSPAGGRARTCCPTTRRARRRSCAARR